MPTYPFTEEEARKAFEEWGCNCGPTALAFALQCKLPAVRYYLKGFEQKRYTNPTLMANAIREAGRTKIIQKVPSRTTAGGLNIDPMFHSKISVVRVQWTGPWTAPGANPRWAYRMTHWIATWLERDVPLVFDCNCGIRGFESWENQIVPEIVKSVDRADGGWHPTHIWTIKLK